MIDLPAISLWAIIEPFWPWIVCGLLAAVVFALAMELRHLPRMFRESAEPLTADAGRGSYVSHPPPAGNRKEVIQ